MITYYDDLSSRVDSADVLMLWVGHVSGCFTAVKPAAVQKNTVKPAAIEIKVRVYYNDYGNHRNNTEGTRF